METCADIYRHIDSNGVLHFTNVPTSSGYELYLKERTKKTWNRSTPTNYDKIIKKAQKKHGVDFHLIKAVIKVESSFNPKAVSKKGAKGLMQIMPANFKSLYISNPYNPSQNIMAGTLYLKRLFKRYDNKLALVLAAYNAGPEAVDKYNSIPPFNETQNYVKKVMETYDYYKNS
ncbi:MAG: lytic transglycosylase domain-containing protein [Desulfobacteraceae bacterium]|nr:lytic transglycosylase domain-containing protein [Desulfobacteraceae bacterium]